MSKFVSCGRNTESVNAYCRACSELKCSGRCSLRPFSVMVQLETFPVSSVLILATYSCPRTQVAAPQAWYSCGAVL